MKIDPTREPSRLPRSEFSALTVTKGLSSCISPVMEGGKSLKGRVGKKLPHTSAGKAVTVVLRVLDNRSYKTRVAPALNPHSAKSSHGRKPPSS